MTKNRRCELKTEFCNGQGVGTYQGKRSDDPVFEGCLACIAILRRKGLKLRPVDRGAAGKR